MTTMEGRVEPNIMPFRTTPSRWDSRNRDRGILLRYLKMLETRLCLMFIRAGPSIIMATCDNRNRRPVPDMLLPVTAAICSMDYLSMKAMGKA